MSEKNEQPETEEKDETRPLTDEEFAEYQKKENRKVRFLGNVVDFILELFRW